MPIVPARVEEARRALTLQAAQAEARATGSSDEDWSEPSIILDSLEEAGISEVVEDADVAGSRPDVEVIAKFGNQEPSRLDDELASAAQSPSVVEGAAAPSPIGREDVAAQMEDRRSPLPRAEDEWGAFVEGLTADVDDTDASLPRRPGRSKVSPIEAGAARAASPRASTRPPGPYVREESLASAVGGGGAAARLVEPGYIGGAVHVDASPGSTQPVWAARRPVPAAVASDGTARILPSAAPVSHGQPLRVAPALNTPQPPSPAVQEESAVTWWQLATAAAVMMAVGAYVSSFGRQTTVSEAAADAPAVAELEAPVESEDPSRAAPETDDSVAAAEWRSSALPGAGLPSGSSAAQAAAPVAPVDEAPDSVDFGAREPGTFAGLQGRPSPRASEERAPLERRRSEAESPRSHGSRAKAERTRPESPDAPAPSLTSNAERPRSVTGEAATGGDGTRPVVPGQPDEPLIPEQLSREQLTAVMSELMPTLQACAGDLHGMADLKLTLRPKGFVSYALVDADFAGTREGSCIAQALRRAKFPAFTAPVMRVSYPVQL